MSVFSSHIILSEMICRFTLNSRKFLNLSFRMSDFVRDNVQKLFGRIFELLIFGGFFFSFFITKTICSFFLCIGAPFFIFFEESD